MGGLTPLQAPHPPEGSPWLVLIVEAEVYTEVLERTSLPMCSAAGASHRVSHGSAQSQGWTLTAPHNGRSPKFVARRGRESQHLFHVPHCRAQQLQTLGSLRGFYWKVMTSDLSGGKELASRPASAVYLSDRPGLVLTSGPSSAGIFPGSSGSSRWKPGLQLQESSGATPYLTDKTWIPRREVTSPGLGIPRGEPD